jgi:hypothetical protein
MCVLITLEVHAMQPTQQRRALSILFKEIPYYNILLFFPPHYCTAPPPWGLNLKGRNSFTRYFFCDLQNELK